MLKAGNENGVFQSASTTIYTHTGVYIDSFFLFFPISPSLDVFLQCKQTAGDTWLILRNSFQLAGHLTK